MYVPTAVLAIRVAMVLCCEGLKRLSKLVGGSQLQSFGAKCQVAASTNREYSALYSLETVLRSKNEKSFHCLG